MTMTDTFSKPEPSRSEIDALPGATLLDFGTPWCGYCQSAQPLILEAFVDYAAVRHIKIEDGSGLALGRSYKVKLWPTLIFLQDGVERTRLVRPANAALIRQALAEIQPIHSRRR
jgi:thioredoxin 1